MRYCVFFLMFLAMASASYADTLVVFDGGDKDKGKAWIHPRGKSIPGTERTADGKKVPPRKSTFSRSVQHPFSNKHHLEFYTALDTGWAGGGWNWCSWKDKGVDLSSYKYLVFRIGVSTKSFKTIKFLFVRLTSGHPGKQDELGPKVIFQQKIEKKNKYVEIRIPMEKLKGGDLDIKNVWGINFEIYGKKSDGSARLFIDQIEFTD